MKNIISKTFLIPIKLFGVKGSKTPSLLGPAKDEEGPDSYRDGGEVLAGKNKIAITAVMAI